MKPRTVIRLVSSAVLIMACRLIAAWAGNEPQLISEVYTPLSRWLISRVGRALSFTELSVAELLLYCLVLLALLWILWLVRQVVRHGLWGLLCGISHITAVVSTVLTVFLLVWGLNYYAEPLGTRLGLDAGSHTREELFAAAEYYRDRLCEYAGIVEREEDLSLSLPDFGELAENAGAGYAALSRTNDIFSAECNPPKRVLASGAMSRLGLSGIFVPFTGEANVNPETPAASLPFTMAHELAHAQGFAPENECNFAAFLCCEAGDDPVFLYSGYYSAFIYCYNAVASVSAEKQTELYDSLPDTVKADIAEGWAHSQKYAGKVREVSEKVNDSYLKTMSVESGTKSYGEVTDLLIAWYLENYSS